VHELEEGGVRSALINAVRAATERAVELGLE
jgi:pyrroline-5-carboxylate reductase